MGTPRRFSHYVRARPYGNGTFRAKLAYGPLRSKLSRLLKDWLSATSSG